MSVLAFKAIGYGAEQIPDKFFEKIPGGFFTPAEKKQRKDARDKKEKDRHRAKSVPASAARDETAAGKTTIPTTAPTTTRTASTSATAGRRIAADEQRAWDAVLVGV